MDIATTFPDPSVQAELLTSSYDSNENGILEESEQTFTYLSLSNKGVKDLRGIELLTQLTSLDVSDNVELTYINAKALVNLVSLSVYNTGLTTLDISGLTKLTSLSAYNCTSLTAIIADGCSSLNYISNWGENNFPSLTSISLKGTAFISFSVSSFSKIESVDLSNCTSLTDFSADYASNLTSLNLSGCTELTYLSVTNNESLATLTVADLPKLTSLSINDNPILNNPTLTGLTALTSLDASNDPGLTTIDVSEMRELETLYLNNTGLTTLDISGLTKLTSLYAYGCASLTTIIADGCSSLNYISNWDESNFPSLTSISLKGTAFISFGISNNTKIESVDLSNCTSLTDFSADYASNLTSLNLSGCTELTYLSVTNNESLATLTVADLPKLTSLSINDNPILNNPTLTGLTALTSLDASNDPGLTTIDVSEMRELETLYLNNTGLTTLDISGLTKLTSLYAYGCASLTTIIADGCSSLNYISNWDESNYPSLTSISLKGTAFPSFDVSNNTKIESVDLSNCASLTSFSAGYASNLTSLKYDGCTAMTNLSLDYCPLITAVDISMLTGLKSLRLSNLSSLENVNFGEGTSLESASIYYNPLLESLTAKSPTMTDLDCSYNSLKTLDVTNCPLLENIYCNYNQLKSLDLSHNTNLQSSSTDQYDVKVELVKISATQVGFVIDENFDAASVESFSINYEEQTPAFFTLDGMQYFIVYNNADDVESYMEDKQLRYGYSTGLEGHTLNNTLSITGYTKAPSFLKVAPESVTGVYGASLDEPTLTRSQDYNGAVTYTSANEQVVKAATDGKLTVIGAGETTVTLSGAETTYRLAPANVTYAVTIEKASPVFSFANNEQEMIIQDDVPANAFDKGVYDGTVVFTSSNETVATIDNEGKVTVLAAGEVTFTASGAATNNCNEPTAASYKLTIKKRTATFTLSAASASGVYGGQIEAPELTIGDYDGKPVYATSNAEVVKVAADGKLTIVGAGEAVITISAPETANYYAPANVTYTVTIEKASPVFTFADAEQEIIIQDDVPANAFDKGVYDGTVVFTSSNETVATIDNEGKVTVLAAGEVTLTASGAATNNCNEPTAASYTLTIKKHTATLALSATSVSGVYGGQIEAPELTIGDFDGQFTYTTSNNEVATVDANGKLTIIGAGEATITISATETANYYAPVNVTYTVTVAKTTPVFTFADAAQEIFILDAVPSNTLDKGLYDGTVVFTSSDETVATIDNDGKVTVLAAGEVTITASGAATNNCNEPTAASYTLTVKKYAATLALSAESVSGVFGDELVAPVLTVGDYDGQPTYATSNEEVATVDANGKLTIVGPGEATITISAPETANYSSASITYQVIVTPKTGDANIDGKVDFADVTAIVNHILGNTPSKFNAQAANVNGDKEVSIADVTSLIETLLHGQ